MLRDRSALDRPRPKWVDDQPWYEGLHSAEAPAPRVQAIRELVHRVSDKSLADAVRIDAVRLLEADSDVWTSKCR